MTGRGTSSRTEIEHALWLGINAEWDWPELPAPIKELDNESVRWIASWLASEGIGRVRKP